MLTSDSFEVIVNGNVVGQYAYADLPVDIGTLTGDCVTQYEILVEDLADRNCFGVLEIDNLCCACRIFNIEFVIEPCDIQGNFEVVLDFDHEGTGTEFRLFQNGLNFGTYQYSQLPITISGLPGDCVTDYQFTIVDNATRDCTAEFSIGPVCCGCAITNLTVNPIRCVGDSCMTIVRSPSIKSMYSSTG